MIDEKKMNELFQKNRFTFLMINIIAIVIHTGTSFTFVIPGLKGFDWTFFAITLFYYFFMGTIFAGLFKRRFLLVFTTSFILSAVGMGWRLWLEWGEVSLAAHMNPVLIIGYPCIVATIILLMYFISAKLMPKKIPPNSILQDRRRI
ncbi:ABC transporter permease [Neobacillus notoginsengisoli]|uniref:ABC transporter permease n=1 Tax=Neobacillus notoginsengisoli TaxID=1578198 RepID=A0A417YSV9_9BACI|nr:ABC transporter permease [Neobacillus notoginsengisoli]RHW39077.1 ABC transporter permease [Neobacillus notoginsengisoli]